MADLAHKLNADCVKPMGWRNDGLFSGDSSTATPIMVEKFGNLIFTEGPKKWSKIAN